MFKNARIVQQTFFYTMNRIGLVFHAVSMFQNEQLDLIKIQGKTELTNLSELKNKKLKNY